MTSAANNIHTDLKPNREQWLEQAIETYWRPKFIEIGFPLPERFHVSVGFGYGAKRENAKLRAQCWSRIQSEDNVNHIFISPEIGDTVEVLRSLGHELAHAALDSDEGIMDGHTKRFAEIVTRLGFKGPMAETPASFQLSLSLLTVADALGEYPHGALLVDEPARVPSKDPATVGGGRVHTGPPRQTNRHLKVTCSHCGYSVRVSQTMLGRGLPRCPDGEMMIPER
jgi:hypothetical protein